jgi:hypothetical protein
MRRINNLTIIPLLVLIILTACHSSNPLKNDSGQTSSRTEIVLIKQLFANWQTQEIYANHFLPTDSCNPNWFTNHQTNESLNSKNDLIFGFPKDSTEYKFSFADLNNDNKLDGLVVFTPNQCDGGNASSWIQWQVFLLSGTDHFEIMDTLKVSNFSSTEFDSKGFYWLDRIGKNRIYGTYIEFTKDDGYCCPSINRPVTFDFIERKLINIGGNIDRK